ncbi:MULTISPECIES: TIM barrel protein [unclassified Streptomyces]|uniref:sugar phosphate isomerase/epimerase family protein n=1 Tax=unclassified Streptomyces TaxID=2593676 RepID=UPI000ABD9381|nr:MULTISPECIES: TIM barrel protein [unclassified Streptomyces]
MPEDPPHHLPCEPAADPAPPLGICSVTFRRLPAAEVVRRAADAGLTVIEWGADVHAPPGDTEALRAAREAGERHGVGCCSYGSYFHGLPDERPGFPEVARAAVTLGAPRVRVWAGRAGSADVTEEERARVTEGLRAAALDARDHGLELALEFHTRTLTDSAASTLRLLEELEEPRDPRAAAVENVTTYWQPPLNAPDDEALAGLAALADRVSAVHVFSWWPGNHRLPLAVRDELWTRAFALLAGRPRPGEALLEFVPDDDPAVLGREAATLRRTAARAALRTGAPAAVRTDAPADAYGQGRPT